MKKESKNDKARVRVFFGEIEGDNETIRDGLRSIAEAVNKTFQQETRVVKVIATSSTPDSKQLTTELQERVMDIEEQTIDIEAGNEESNGHSSGSDSEKQRSRSSRPRKTPSYSFIKDLNLRPEGKQSLRQFFEEKKPSNQQEQLTTAIFYMHRVLGIENITVNHVFTALKELTEFGVRVPPDIPQGLRTISNRKGWVDSSNANALKTTTRGDNFVEHDLPKSKAETS